MFLSARMIQSIYNSASFLTDKTTILGLKHVLLYKNWSRALPLRSSSFIVFGKKKKKSASVVHNSRLDSQLCAFQPKISLLLSNSNSLLDLGLCYLILHTLSSTDSRLSLFSEGFCPLPATTSHSRFLRWFLV